MRGGKKFPLPWGERIKVRRIKVSSPLWGEDRGEGDKFCACSSTDRAAASGAACGGSIPLRRAIN